MKNFKTQNTNLIATRTQSLNPSIIEEFGKEEMLIVKGGQMKIDIKNFCLNLNINLCR